MGCREAGPCFKIAKNFVLHFHLGEYLISPQVLSFAKMRHDILFTEVGAIKMNFSVDMIRMYVRVFREELDFFQILLDSGSIEHYLSNDIASFRHNFKIEETVSFSSENPFSSEILNTGINKIWLGFDHNSSVGKDKAKTSLYIEYNPNKTDLSFGTAKLVFDRFFKNSADIVVVSCDIAIDFFDVTLDDLVFCKNGKQKYNDYREGKGRTIYFGTKKSSGRTKVYNKAVESKSDLSIWTRVEYSFKLDLDLRSILSGYFNFDCNIPELSFFKYDNLDLTLDIKDKCCIFSILQGFVSLDSFAYRTKQKLKSIIDSRSDYVLDYDTVYQPCKDCLCSYLRGLYDYVF